MQYKAEILKSTCNFGDRKDFLIRDRIVCGTHDSSLQERLWRETDLDTCIQIAGAADLSRESINTIIVTSAE